MRLTREQVQLIKNCEHIKNCADCELRAESGLSVCVKAQGHLIETLEHAWAELDRAKKAYDEAIAKCYELQLRDIKNKKELDRYKKEAESIPLICESWPDNCNNDMCPKICLKYNEVMIDET